MGTDRPKSVEDYCGIHYTENTTCGGPHREEFTDIGWEVLGPSEHARGIPEKPAAEDEARRWSTQQKR
jgi:hypothetical protein